MGVEVFGDASALSAYVFVFRPGGVAAGNVYTTWATVYAAATAPTSQGLRVIYIDLSLNGSASVAIPSGTYNFTDIEIIGKWTATALGFPTIAFAAGTTWSVPPRALRNIFVTCAPAVGTVTCTIDATTTSYRITLDGALLSCVGAGTIIDIPLTRAYNFNLINEAILTRTNGAVVNIAGSMSANLGNSVTIGSNTLTGAGTLGITQNGVRIGYSPTQGFAGTFTNTDASAKYVYFGGTMIGAAGAVVGYLGTEALAVAAAAPQGKPVISPRVWTRIVVNVLANTLASSTTATVYANGVATAVTVTIGAASGATTVVSALFQVSVTGSSTAQALDIRLDNTAGGALNAITCLASAEYH